MQIRQLTDDGKAAGDAAHPRKRFPTGSGYRKPEEYIAESAGKAFFCAYDGDSPAGFLYLKETGRDTIELYVMGVLPQLHRRGVGRELLNRASAKPRGDGLRPFMQVKTVQMGKYPQYDRTNRFYRALGF